MKHFGETQSCFRKKLFIAIITLYKNDQHCIDTRLITYRLLNSHNLEMISVIIIYNLYCSPLLIFIVFISLKIKFFSALIEVNFIEKKLKFNQKIIQKLILIILIFNNFLSFYLLTIKIIKTKHFIHLSNLFNLIHRYTNLKTSDNKLFIT